MHAVLAPSLLMSAVAAPLTAQKTPARAAAPTVQVSIVRAKDSTPLHTVLLVRVEGKGLALGAYEGRIRFDPAVFVVDSATPGTDGSRFVNPADAPKGFVRFAGFTPTGFKSVEAVRLVGHASKSLDAAKLGATLEVAGDLEGKQVPKTGLVHATRVEQAK